MKSQKSIIESDWEGGKPFLSRTKNEDVSIDENYYVGREHLFDPKAKKPKSGSFFSGSGKVLVISGVSIFAIVSFFSESGFGSNLGVSIVIFLIVAGVMLFTAPKGVSGVSSSGNENAYSESVMEIDDSITRSLSIYSVDKMFYK